LRTSNREWILLVASIACLAPLRAAAETYTFKIGKDGGKLQCTRAEKVVDTPPDAIVVKLTRDADAAQEAQLVPASEPGAPPGNPIAPQPGATKTAVEWKLLKDKAAGLTLLIVDPRNKELACPLVPTVAATDEKPLDVETATWWEQNRTRELEKLKAGHPAGTQLLVHYENGEPASPFPSSLTERKPIQIAVIVRPGKTGALTLSITACEKVVPFRIREPPPPGKPQAKETEAPQPVVLPHGPELRCGAGTFSYSLGKEGAPSVHSLRVRPVSHLSFTSAYGFDFTRVPSFAVENGKVARTSDRAGLGLRLGLTWFPLGIDYEDMKPWNYVNPVFAFDPTSPTENFLAGAAITPTGGFALLVGANFRRRTVLRGTTVGADITGTEVPTAREWNGGGVGLYVGLSVDDDVFTAIKGRLGQ
jgi:hypothetical protein